MRAGLTDVIVHEAHQSWMIKRGHRQNFSHHVVQRHWFSFEEVAPDAVVGTQSGLPVTGSLGSAASRRDFACCHAIEAPPRKHGATAVFPSWWAPHLSPVGH